MFFRKPVPEISALPAWPPVEGDWSPYMALHNATPVLKKSLTVKERANFWVPIYEKYHRNPIPPINSTMSHTDTGLVPILIFLLMYKQLMDCI